MGHSKSSANMEVYSNTILSQETRKISKSKKKKKQITLTLHLKQLEKEEQEIIEGKKS